MADDAALAAVAHRVTQRILRSVAGLVSRANLALAAASRSVPAVTGAELVSRADVHAALVAELVRARGSVEVAVRAGNLAAATVGAVSARADLSRLGHTTAAPGPDPEHLAAVLGDVADAFSAALPDIQEGVRAGLDGVAGDSPNAIRARRLTTHAALRRVAKRLAVRLRAAGSVAVYRGYADTQAQAWNAYAAINPYGRLTKTWQARGDDPCPVCLALHGVTVAIDAQFDRSLGAGEKNPGVYRDLRHPPRHPGCRCGLRYGFADENSALSFR